MNSGSLSAQSSDELGIVVGALAVGTSVGKEYAGVVGGLIAVDGHHVHAVVEDLLPLLSEVGGERGVGRHEAQRGTVEDLHVGLDHSASLRDCTDVDQRSVGETYAHSAFLLDRISGHNRLGEQIVRLASAVKL